MSINSGERRSSDCLVGSDSRTSPVDFLSLANVMPLKGVDARMGEHLEIVPTPGYGRIVGGGGEPGNASVRWAAMDAQSCESTVELLDVHRAIYHQPLKERRYERPIQPETLEDSRQKKVIKEISHDATHEEAERLGDGDVVEGDALLVKNRKGATQDYRDLKELEANVLQLIKKLDDANAAQKVAVKALEEANEEMRLLNEDAAFQQLEGTRLKEAAELDKAEIARLRKSLEVYGKRKRKADAEVAGLLSEKNQLLEMLDNADENFMANFHLTKAYTNFSNYFASVGQQKVLATLRSEHLDLDIASLEAKFSPVVLRDEGEE
ncbi:hypothetical protein Adt_23537 [Abeliophyllum distichum]|uniref:Uncharacterized protein n=1 Tax=Abeliophyllum distichum TaxID=126358 RepID=A0ABD1SB53_9LAMI